MGDRWSTPRWHGLTTPTGLVRVVREMGIGGKLLVVGERLEAVTVVCDGHGTLDSSTELGFKLDCVCLLVVASQTA